MSAAFNADQVLDDMQRRAAEAAARVREQNGSADHGADGDSWPREPEPLRRPLPAAEPYPVDALGRVLGSAVSRMHEVLRAPLAVCGQSVLAAASLAAQKHCDVVLDGRREPLSLFAVTVAESGERKSAADQIALRPHREYERAELDKYRDEKADYDDRLLAWETARKTAASGKNKTPAAIRSAIQDQGEKPKEPLNPIIITPQPTIEGLHKHYQHGPASVGLFNDDAAEFIGGHAMNKDNKSKSAAGLSRLWDCGEFDRIRAGDGASKHFGRRLALHLMIQPVIAEMVLDDDVLTGQGFLARALLSWPVSNIGNRTYVALDLETDPAIRAYRDRMLALLQRPAIMRAGGENELEPRALLLQPDAKRQWIGVHDAIEADQRDGGEFASVRAWASKGAAQVLRVAGVLTLAEDIDARSINADAVQRAAALVDHHLKEAARIVGTASVPRSIQLAEALLGWCQRERIQLLQSRAALRLGPNRIRSTDSFDEAIQVLERTGWARRVTDETKRRQPRTWEIYGGGE